MYLQLLKYWILSIVLADDIVIMKAYKGETNMTSKIHRLTGTVVIETITEFERVNTHVKLRWPEKFVAITMRSPEGMVCVTMTRKHSKFAESVAVGQTITVSGMLKREQDYNQMGGQVVLTNCTIGIPASVGLAEKRAAKKLARARKLGLA